jgi:4,5:9,10-diseco-3-hydroxy-5,9,17-trioxoandrosta-1(10),2-diene-4-oate hydrolase
MVESPRFRSEAVLVDGVSLAVKRAGRGPVVLCLHAVGHDANDFAPLSARLGDCFEFVCVEWPGHGDSGADVAPASAERYAELVEAAAWQLSLRDPIVIGNSIGGAVAIRFASRRRVRALVLCNSGGLIAVDRTVRRFCEFLSRFFRGGERGAWWFKPLFGLYYRMVLPTPAAAEQRNRIVANAYRIAPILAQAWRSFGESSADVRQSAAQLCAPIWIAWAKRDRLIPLDRCRPAIGQLQNATLDEFDGGHTAFLELPDEFADKFLRFASGLSSRPQPAGLTDNVAA